MIAYTVFTPFFELNVNLLVVMAVAPEPELVELIVVNTVGTLSRYGANGSFASKGLAASPVAGILFSWEPEMPEKFFTQLLNKRLIKK